MTDEPTDVTGGVDTHGESHVAAVLDAAGRLLGTGAFAANGAGYRALVTWMASFGPVARVGVEGTGAYGAGLARHLATAQVTVIEVDRANRQMRRRRGKSDTVDAEAAARAALNGAATGTPKAADGTVEAIRALRMVRRSALKARTQVANQIRDLILTAPEELRARLRGLDTDARVEICARLRPGALNDPAGATKWALRSLARRHQALTGEISEADAEIAELCTEANPALVGAHGVGAEVAATLLVTAGDNPDRLSSEASFAALCGASPIEASSGKQTRHRLNRGGDRSANNALWRIVMVRLSHDTRTQAYAQRRRAQGKTDRDITRCLKRYVAREIYQLLTNPPQVPDGAHLRHARTSAGLTLTDAAEALATWPTRLSELERSLKHDTDLATRYQLWLDAQPAA